MIADAIIQAPRRQTNTSVCRHREGLAVRRVPRFFRAFPCPCPLFPFAAPYAVFRLPPSVRFFHLPPSARFSICTRTRSDVARNALVTGSTLFTFMPLLRLCRMIRIQRLTTFPRTARPAAFLAVNAYRDLHAYCKDYRGNVTVFYGRMRFFGISEKKYFW